MVTDVIIFGEDNIKLYILTFKCQSTAIVLV